MKSIYEKPIERKVFSTKTLFVFYCVMMLIWCVLGMFVVFEKGKNASKAGNDGKLGPGIGELISLKMEYAYKQGQWDAMHGIYKIQIMTNEVVNTNLVLESNGNSVTDNVLSVESWKWIESPWDGDLKPHNPNLVDANNNLDILERLQEEK